MSTPPDVFDDLDPPPYPVQPKIDLRNTEYPEDALWGLGRMALLPSSVWAFESWTNRSQFDYFAFRAGDLTRPIASGNAMGDEPRYFLSFPGHALPDGVHKHFGRVLRIGSNQESRSVTEETLFKTSIPAGDDPNESEPWHSGLYLWIVGMREGGTVNQDTADAGFWAVIGTYVNMRKNDKLKIYVDGHLFEHIVSPTEAAQGKPIRVFIPPETLNLATSKGPFNIRLGVEDVVGNTPQGKYTLSKPFGLYSDRDAKALDRPIVTANGVEDDSIDLDTQSNDTFEVLVFPTYKKPAPKPPNKIVLVFDITKADGSTETVRLPSVNDRNLQNESIPISNTLFKNMGRGWIRVWYEWLNSAGVVIGTSASFVVDVIGTPTQMPALTLVPYQAGLIPPDKDVAATVPIYSPYNKSYLETIICEGEGVGGDIQRVVSKQLAGAPGGVRLLTKKSLEVFKTQNTFRVYYDVDNGEGKPSSIRRSEVLDAMIGLGGGNLPAPIIVGVKDGNLDLDDLNAYEAELLIPFSNTKSGQIIHWSVVGSSPKNSAGGIIDINNSNEGDELLDLVTPLELPIFFANVNGHLDASYTLETPGSPPTLERSEVLRFSIGKPVKLLLLKLLEANATELTIDPLAVIKGASVEVHYEPSLAVDNITVKWAGEYNVSQYEQTLKGDPNAKVFKFHVPESVISRALRSGGNTVNVTCSVLRGAFTRSFLPLTLLLLPIKLRSPFIVGYENSTVLPVSELITATRISIKPWPYMSAGQYIWLRCSGTFSDGAPYSEDIYTANEVIASDLPTGISRLLPLDIVPKLQDGSVFKIEAHVSFPRIPLLFTATPFEVAIYIIDLLPRVLVFPTLTAATSTAQTTTADPLAIQKNPSATVAYKGMLATDSIIFEVVFEDGTKYSVTLKGQASGTVLVDLALANMPHKSVSRRVQLKYSIVRGGKTTPSEVQTIAVGMIPVANIPRVLFNNQATGATIDLNSFVGNPTVTQRAWPLSMAGQRIWITVIGSGRSQEVLSGYPITAAQAVSGFVNMAVLRGVLTALSVNTWYQVEVRVAFDGDANKPRAIVFPISQYLNYDSFSYVDYVFTAHTGSWALGPVTSGAAYTGLGLYFTTPFNPSYQYAGVLMSQTLNFNAAHTYQVSVVIYNYSYYGYPDPKLSFDVGGAQVIAPTLITTKLGWTTLTANFKVGGPSLARLWSHVSGGNGNDFVINRISIRRIT